MARRSPTTRGRTIPSKRPAARLERMSRFLPSTTRTCFATHTGVHTNAVEGLHMHLKRFLRKFSLIGCDRILRTNIHVIAAAVMSSPKHSATNSRVQKLLHAFRTVAQYNVPAETIAADFRTKTFVGPFSLFRRPPTALWSAIPRSRSSSQAEFEDHERREEERRATAESARNPRRRRRSPPMPRRHSRRRGRRCATPSGSRRPRTQWQPTAPRKLRGRRPTCW